MLELFTNYRLSLEMAILAASYDKTIPKSELNQLVREYDYTVWKIKKLEKKENSLASEC